MSPVIARPTLLFLAMALAAMAGGPGLVGCSANQSATGAKCTLDVQCGTGLCMSGTCLPRSADRTVAVEIVPRIDSMAARTGIPSVALGPDTIELAADDRVLIDGTVTNSPNAHVVLLVANPIPGQADLQFETDLVDSTFEISLGRRLIKSMATIWLTPNVDVQKQPPVPFVTMLDQTLTFTFPPASQMAALRGVLHDSLDMPVADFLVRALVDAKVVSNVATTDASGMFQLLIAPGAVPDDSSASVVVDFTPVATDSGPRFQTLPFSLAMAAANAKPRVFRMPAFLTPAPLRFAVQADGGPVADVTMRFHTEIPAGTDGKAIYERERHSDATGEVDVNLIPGTSGEPQSYQISIMPPPDSPYGSRCILSSAVTNVGNDVQPQYSSTFHLDPKVILKGTIVGNGSSPAATVSVTATQVVQDSDSGCANTGAAPQVSSTTLRNGTYEMLVDPGTYRLDIDPPVGADVPRLTQDAVVVSGDPITFHDISLPSGQAIMGRVNGMDGMPLTSASIKIFDVQCTATDCVPPVLRAQTRTDDKGMFRAVLPLP